MMNELEMEKWEITLNILEALKTSSPETRAEWRRMSVEHFPEMSTFCDQALKVVESGL